MSAKISASVGSASLNRRTDVKIVQFLLSQRGINPGPIDGLCGPRTVRAILDFQSRFLSSPDGRVDPDGVTLRHLNDARAQVTSMRPPAPSIPIQNIMALVPRQSRDSINQGLVAVSPAFMVQQLGRPRESYSSNCQPMTNPNLLRHVVIKSIGKFKVEGLRPAVDSLSAALAQIRNEQPAVYDALGTAGMLCCRYVRGSTSAISNHSWGTAIDFTLNSMLDRRGDNRVQVGLTLIAPILNQHGWYWGAAFRTEDAMHFEASRSLITKWVAQLR